LAFAKNQELLRVRSLNKRELFSGALDPSERGREIFVMRPLAVNTEMVTRLLGYRVIMMVPPALR
jgi:hypothetical protein